MQVGSRGGEQEKEANYLEQIRYAYTFQPPVVAFILLLRVYPMLDEEGEGP